MKITYEFEVKDMQMSKGYKTLTISNGQAEIDPADTELVAMALELGGKPQKPAKGDTKPLPPLKAKKEVKTDGSDS